jgi:hypothetical protein
MNLDREHALRLIASPAWTEFLRPALQRELDAAESALLNPNTEDDDTTLARRVRAHAVSRAAFKRMIELPENTAATKPNDEEE